MDWKMKKQLLEKYWKAESSPEEEQWLKENISKADQELMSKAEAEYFRQLKDFSNLQADEMFKLEDLERPVKNGIKAPPVLFFRRFRNIAAAALLLFAIGGGTYYLSNDSVQSRVVATDEEDPEKAFELAKQSLMLISQKLNKGADHVGALEKFDLVHDKIKSDKTPN